MTEAIKRGGVQLRLTDMGVGATVTPLEGSDSLAFRGGHAAVFNQPTFISLGMGMGYVERFADGSFDAVLADPKLDTRMLFNHDKSLLLARTINQTLRLGTDKVGLTYDADMAPTSYARDLAILLDRRDVSQSSFAFTNSPGGEDWDEVSMRGPDGKKVTLPRVTIREVSGLYDVSPVTYAAYSGTDVGKRMGYGLDGENLTVDIVQAVTAPTPAQLRELENYERLYRGGMKTL